MAGSYNSLLNKYNTLVAKCQALQESLKLKEEQWSKKAAEYDVVEDNARTLCKLILAKDKSQINIGTESGSWGSLSTRDLIVQATQSYKKYNKERAIALQQILDIAEERQDTIDGLKTQIAYYENNKTGDAKEYEKVLKEEQEKETLQNVIDNTDYETKKALKENHANISIVDDDDDLNSFITDSMNELDIITPTNSSVPINANNKLREAREKQRQKKVFKKYAAEVDLGRYLNDMSELQKAFIYTIGSEGLSEQSEIIKRIQNVEEYKEQKSKTFANKVYTAAKELQGMGIIISESVIIPLTGKSNCNIIRLTEMGNRLYYIMTDKKPVIAEANLIQTEHDNIHHGYGIKAIYQGIKESGLYNKTNMNCRKDPLVVDPQKNQNVTYIPDIFTLYKNGNIKCFFEYERGLSTKDTIIEKCNKMVRFTRDMYFLTDTKEHVESLLKNLVAWKKEAMNKQLKVRVYLSTARYFQANNYDIKKDWMCFLPENSAEPITKE